MTSPPQSAQPGAKKPDIEPPPRPPNSNTQRAPLSLHTWVSACVCVTGFIGLRPHIIESFCKESCSGEQRCKVPKAREGLGSGSRLTTGKRLVGDVRWQAYVPAVGWVCCIAYSPGLKSPQRAAGSPGPWHFFPFLDALGINCSQRLTGFPTSSRQI